jgi:hypothetical protein
MIELKHFIAQTLTEIIEGVVEAQGRVDEYGAKVSPHVRQTGYEGGYRYEARSQAVEFDVEVTTADSSSSKKGLGVFVAPIAAGTQGLAESRSTSVGRIKFQIVLQLPLPDK